ncbi:hypothetical protein [Anoxybacteroides rupiense]|jgi:amino acid transporter|uniref:hypothetical protein n=1 Tax=Anoxybacteroides rupiense TaxID=311460 RepID=UPI0018333929|nr:hypothetical protein [Anoxybacillus rupiensis]MBB3908002.1 amino acid transporter [Anoxybacillus rupiensis]
MMTALIASAFLSIILTMVLLSIKAVIERKFNRRRKISSLHVANVLLLGIIIAGLYYILSEANSRPSFPSFFYVYFGAIQLLLPIYALVCIGFSKYERKRKKYIISPDKKVLYIKEEYLARGRHDNYQSKTS